MSDFVYDDMELMEKPGDRRRHFLKVTLVVFAAWTAIGILNAFQRFANTSDMRDQYPLWTARSNSQWPNRACSCAISKMA